MTRFERVMWFTLAVMFVAWLWADFTSPWT
jgi:hypothetical protein